MFTRVETSGTDVHVHLYGVLDGIGALALQAGVAAAPLGPHSDLLLDLTGVEMIDEAGLGTLLFLGRRLAARRRTLRLTGVRAAWLARLRDLGLGEPADRPPAMARAAHGRGRESMAARRPARGPEGE